MTTPTSEELLELYTELNYPSAVKFRAGILRAGYKVRLADVQKFVDAQTPKQLFQKKPLHRGNVIASRANERWMLDLIDYTTMPDGAFKYVLMGIDVFSRHVFAEATNDKVPATFIAVTKRLVATYGKPQEINADSEFEASKAYQTFLRNQGIQFRGKENINDLAVLDSNMAQLKKQIAKLMQVEHTKKWRALLTRAVRGFNRQSHEGLLGETPRDARHIPEEAPNNPQLEFELREQAGRKMQNQHAVVRTNQHNTQEQGAFRTYIGRADARKRGDKPLYGGTVHLVDSVSGNKVTDTHGKEHSLTTVRPVPADSENVNITLRLAGSKQQEDIKRKQFKQFADKLVEILSAHNGPMWTSKASLELRRDPAFARTLGRMTFAAFVKLFPNKLKLQTGVAGGASKVMLK